MNKEELLTLTEFCQQHEVHYLVEDSPGYEETRLIYNRIHNLRPKLILQTLDRPFLSKFVKLLSQLKIETSIRGGGHHIAGFSSCDGGVMIDFSPFKEISMSEDYHIAVRPGARLKEVDAFLSQHNRTLPTGTVSDTGIAGLTLGGGIGWQIGTFGLTCDNLVSAEVLLADGTIIEASETQNPELLWALRGGGGNFGIVLEFRYRTHPQPKYIVGTIEVPIENAKAALEKLAKYLDTSCPDQLTVAPVVLPVTVTSKAKLSIEFCESVQTSGQVSYVSELTGLFKDAKIEVDEGADFTKWQSVSDAEFVDPKRGYWKCRYLTELNSRVISVITESIDNCPKNVHATVLIEHLHGRAFCQPDLQSAFPLRDMKFGILFSIRWDKSDDDEKCIHWARTAISNIDAGESESKEYSNYTIDDENSTNAVYAKADQRTKKLTKIKSTYDPHNFFHRNHNIAPLTSQET